MHTTTREKSENSLSVKKLRVYGVFRDKVNESVLVPEIRISGFWLQQLGVNYGKDIMVTIAKGTLIIQLMDEIERLNGTSKTEQMKK